MEQRLDEAHRYSSRNRVALEGDPLCGCFHCLRIFPPAEIDEWVDDDNTAVCPFCGIDAVIGQSSGYELTPAFLREMHDRWF